jgi:serine/threonine protein kinase
MSSTWTINDFTVLKTLGEGAFGKVDLAEDRKSEQKALVALKMKHKKHILENKMTNHFKREVDIQRGLKQFINSFFF